MSTEATPLARLLHELRIGCLERIDNEDPRPGDDDRTHRLDADRILAAGVPRPIHAEGLCVPCGSPATVVIAPFPMCRPCAEATLERERAEHAALRETARLYQVEVSGAAWTLVASRGIGTTRTWRALTAEESEEVFDRLLMATTRFARALRAAIEVKG